MILEYKLELRDFSSGVYEKIFLRTIEEHDLVGKIFREHFLLELYVEAKSTEELEKFATAFAKNLPQSIFLYNTEAQVVDEFPTKEEYQIPKTKIELPFCPKCAEEVLDSNHADYFNIFKSCEVCGYDIEGLSKSYEDDIKEIANRLKDGKIININTSYGNYNIGLPTSICNEIKADYIAYDYATVKKYTEADEEELKAIASFEKPFIKFKKNMSFLVKYEDIKSDILRVKLPDDFLLYFLMRELSHLDEPFIFITKDDVEFDDTFHLLNPKVELEPIEIVVSKTDKAIIKGEKGLFLPEEPLREKTVPSHGSLLSIINEHQLDVENIANIYMSKERGTRLIVRGKKYGFIKYLDFKFSYNSISEILDAISSTDETAKKLIDNYSKKFPEHIENIKKISWEKSDFSIYELWGIVAIVLDLTKDSDLHRASKVLEENHLSFLGEKGPRIDYKLQNINNETFLDPLLVIRSGISFKLAGVDDLTLSFGFVESFVEFLAHEFDTLKESMGVEAVAISGSMLENKRLFMRLCKDLDINHDLYCNNLLAVDGDTIFY